MEVEGLIGRIQGFQGLVPVYLDIGLVSHDKSADLPLTERGGVRYAGDQDHVAVLKAGLHTVAVYGEDTVGLIHLPGGIEEDGLPFPVELGGIAEAGGEGFAVGDKAPQGRTGLCVLDL